ncbi:MAG TPA: hypothetical protein VMW69_08325 [Spirochaetia bacterium]|nr:hypothetical protein [Spirochaetia bacterium]
MSLRVGLFVTVVLIASFLTACTTLDARLTTPSGFAEFRHTSDFRIVSPEGVVLRVRTAENKPEQTIDFWAKTLKRQLSQSGYALLAEGTFDPKELPLPAASRNGAYFEWSAPVGTEDYTYLTAVALANDQIVIVEAAGPIEYYKEHEQQIHKALETLTISNP